MEVHLFEIASRKTSDPRELADLEELTRCALQVAAVEREHSMNSAGRRPQNGSPSHEQAGQRPSDEEQAKGRVYVLQSRFCRRADSASEAIESIVGFEREELEFLHLLSDLAGQSEQSHLRPLIRSKEELVDGMQLFVDTWK